MIKKSNQACTTCYTDPALREKLKEKIKEGTKGGDAGKWSARKAQLLAKEYKAESGKYTNSGRKTKSQKSLIEWQNSQK